LLTLADLDRVTLTVYVPESDLGQVQLGQPVSVTVDAYPERVFPGTAVFVASEAEFTPKNIQTREERVNMVFAVKVKLPNGDHALKPGMPADAVLQLRDE
jgi:multidrug efflux pump subunit AcrA (membrane-fusion protein)